MRVAGGRGCEGPRPVWGMGRGGWGTVGQVRGGDDNSGGCPGAVAGAEYWGWRARSVGAGRATEMEPRKGGARCVERGSFQLNWAGKFPPNFF